MHEGEGGASTGGGLYTKVICMQYQEGDYAWEGGASTGGGLYTKVVCMEYQEGDYAWSLSMLY